MLNFILGIYFIATFAISVMEFSRAMETERGRKMNAWYTLGWLASIVNTLLLAGLSYMWINY